MLLGDYIMALHMEEFLDVDYVEKVSQVLKRGELDVLFGNMRRTSLGRTHVDDLLTMTTASNLDKFLTQKRLKKAPRGLTMSERTNSPTF